jgi:hypothetical protein
MQLWNFKLAGFFSSGIFVIEMSFADILHEINKNLKGANLIQYTQINITCTEYYRCFDFVMLVNKCIASLRVEHLVFW